MTEPRIPADRRARLRERWAVALAIGSLSCAFALWRHHQFPSFTSDLDQLWFAAKALLRGDDPYQAVGPGRTFPWAWPVFYPLPAIMLVVPLTYLPVAAARVVFSTMSGALLGFAVGPRWRFLWPMFLSEAFYFALSRNQWSPFILSAFWLPVLGFLIAVKPNVGLAVLAGQDRRGAAWLIGLAALFLALSFAVRPTWLAEWLALARVAPNKLSVVLQPWGFVLLATLVLVRSRDGRLLLAASVIPQTPSLYDLLLLFPLCRTVRQALSLAVLTHVLQWIVFALGPYRTFDAYYSALARTMVYAVFVPAMLIAFWNRRAAPGPSTPVHGVAGAAERPASRFALEDWALLFVLLMAECLQFWIIFRP